MQSEGFDKKIIDAAENHHPPYDEKAWMKMEKLLDKHLPEEKEKKRRFLLIIFFFLLLGGGYILFGLGKGKSGVKELAYREADKKEKAEDLSRDAEKKDKVGGDPVTNDNSGEVKTETDLKKVNTDNNTEKLPAGDITQPGNKKPAITNAGKISGMMVKGPGGVDRTTIPNKTVATGRKEKINSTRIPAAKKRDETIVSKAADGKQDQLIKGKEEVVLNKEDAIFKAIQPDTKKEPARNTEVIAKADNTKPVATENKTADKKELTAAKNDSVSAVAKTETTKKNRKKGSFFIAASIAPDLSIVGVSDPGKVKLAAGAGLGYTKGRFTLRSGFYTARKVYDAYPDSYHAPSAFYYRYPNLQEVKADCRVYEIPLLVSYNFKKGGKSNWFATTGLSSYLMKSETYDYYYKQVVTGPTVNRKRTITNANQHYFSVVTLGAGYQRTIGKRFSLLAEPYMKIPMTGIGFGKVKLNSAGVQFSLAFKPFGSNIKK